MRVEFDDLQQYLDEIKAEAKSGLKLVRVSGDEQKVNSGVTQIFLVSGFVTENDLCELKLYCGDDLLGGGTDGTKAFGAALDRLGAVCKTSGIELRGGAYRG